MGIANLNASDIVAFAAREGNKMIEAQVNMKARLFAALDKVPMKGRRSIINVVNGGVASTAQVEDFGSLPSEAGVVPAQGFVDAVGYVSRLGLGRIALETLAGVDDSADLLDLQLQLASEDMARQIGRAVYGNQLSSPASNGTWAPTSVAGQISVTVPVSGGIADFREGEAYTWEGSGSATPSIPVLCTNVALVAGNDNVVNVTFLAGVGGVPGFDTATVAAAIVTASNGPTGSFKSADSIYLRGSRAVTPLSSYSAASFTSTTRADANTGLVNLQGITSTTAALHGLPAGANGWTGISFTTVGAPTAELFMGKSKLLQARAGVAPTHLVLGDLASAAYGAAQISAGQVGFGGNTSLTQPRRTVDGKLDKYGKDGDLESGLSMFGRPVLIDSNCPATEAYLINKDYLKVGEWKKLSAEDEGGSPLLLSRSTFSKEVQFSCIYNLICRKRNAHARLTGVSVV